MRKHVTFVGALHIGWGAFGLLVALTVLLLVVGGGMIGGAESKEPIVFAVTAIMGALIALWAVCLCVPGIIGGIGALRLKPWARYLVLVLSVLYLFNIPIGTAVGVYSIWVMAQDKTAKLFAGTSGE